MESQKPDLSPARKEEDVEEYLSDLEFFEEGLTDKPKVTREIALTDFRILLVRWKILKKAIRKAKSGKKNAQKREEFEDQKEVLIDAIQSGSLVIEQKGASGITVTHNLIDPPTAFDHLEYKRMPKAIDMRKMDGFEETENFAQMQAIAAAMSGKAVAELVGLSIADFEVITALFYFFA